MKVSRVFASVLCLATAITCAAQTATTTGPPMGWNSWDSYGLTVDEAQFRDNAKVEAEKLLPAGYRYAVIDEGWFLRNPEDRPHPEKLVYELDATGRYIPVPSRFPSAIAGDAGRNSGFAALATAVHAEGLRFGIHIVRGIPRESVRQNLPIEGTGFEGADFKAQDAADQADACPWDPTNWGVRDNAAGQAWYDALLRQYATWGVDFLKVDCIADHPYKASEIRQIRLAIERSGRPIVLSLSPGPTQLEHAAEVEKLAQMWRISNDVWDVWRTDAAFPRSVYDQFALAAAWAPLTHAGAWADADMLPLGEQRPRPDIGPGPRHTRLTPDEQRTMLTLWSMARSPLILGGNLTLLDAATTALITDRDLVRIDQQATASRQVLRRGDMVVWTADLPRNEQAVAVFNVGDQPLTVDLALPELHLRSVRVRFARLRSASGGGSLHRIRTTLAPHASTLLFAHGR